MNELTPEQMDELRQALERLREDIEQQLTALREGTKPVELDEPIGRLTRMDAIQQQNMARASRRSLDLRLRQVVQALGSFAKDEYGLCRRCEDPIGYPRLKARPESPYCIECQDEVDAKYSQP